jgi:hypothetical protein
MLAIVNMICVPKIVARFMVTEGGIAKLSFTICDVSMVARTSRFSLTNL